MPTSPSRRDNSQAVSLWSDDEGRSTLDGLDYETNLAKAGPRVLVVGESLRLDQGTVSRKKGAKKPYRFTEVTGSWTFGAVTKYAKIPAASQLEVTEGGHALRFSFTAVWPAAGKTAYILASRIAGVAYHAMYATLSDAGVLTVGWTANSDASDVSVASTALGNGATAHVLAIHDAAAGTYTLYIDGASDGTPVTGIAVTEKPKSGTGEDWYVAVHWNPSAGPAAVVADTHFSGKIDALCLMSLRGKRPADGTPSLITVLRKHTFRQWPTPQMDMVLFCYDFDSDTVTTLIDRSRHKNTCTITGTPTATAAVALASQPTHYVGNIELPSGKKTNVVGIYGSLIFEDTRADT